MPYDWLATNLLTTWAALVTVLLSELPMMTRLNLGVPASLNLVPVMWWLTILGVLALWFLSSWCSLLIEGGTMNTEYVLLLKTCPRPTLLTMLMLKMTTPFPV